MNRRDAKRKKTSKNETDHVERKGHRNIISVSLKTIFTFGDKEEVGQYNTSSSSFSSKSSDLFFSNDNTKKQWNVYNIVVEEKDNLFLYEDYYKKQNILYEINKIVLEKEKKLGYIKEGRKGKYKIIPINCCIESLFSMEEYEEFSDIESFKHIESIEIKKSNQIYKSCLKYFQFDKRHQKRHKFMKDHNLMDSNDLSRFLNTEDCILAWFCHKKNDKIMVGSKYEIDIMFLGFSALPSKSTRGKENELSLYVSSLCKDKREFDGNKKKKEMFTFQKDVGHVKEVHNEFDKLSVVPNASFFF